MGWQEFIPATVFFGLAYFFQSLFGFGAAFIVVLGLSLFIPIQSVIGMIPVSLMAVAAITVLRDSDKVRWGRIFRMFLISFPGVAVGALILNRMPSRAIVIAVSLLILAYSLYSLTVERVSIPRFLSIPYLLASGFIIGTTGLGIVYVPLSMQEIPEPAELRVSLNLMWLLLGLVRLPIYLMNGVVTREYFLMGLAVIPVMFGAMLIGRRVNNRIRPEQFHKLALIFLSVLAVARILSEWI